MRRVLLLLLAVACWWTYHTYHAPPPEVAVEPPPAASESVATAPEGVERLWAMAEQREEPARDPIVLCETGSESHYLRQSECELQGRPAAEPGWARLD